MSNLNNIIYGFANEYGKCPKADPVETLDDAFPVAQELANESGEIVYITKFRGDGESYEYTNECWAVAPDEDEE